MSDTQKKFYLTTPIYYVNARPHIGHAYTTIVADVIARRHRLLGDDTFFLTGTDEHGQKIERSAAAAGIPPQQFADQVSIEFRNLWDRMGLTYDDYIRTTDPRHKQGAQKLFALLEKNGLIELKTYTGQYCVSEEMFVDGPPGTIGPDGKPTETVSEENYFFKLSAFQKPLIDLIESGQLAIQPEARKNEVLSFLRGNVTNASNAVILSEAKDPRILPDAPTTALSAAGNPYVPGALKDLSISRSSFKWGIPVPGNEKHVIYVWLDALANYMTAMGYGSDDPAEQAKFAKYWPADLHLVGKEIIRFHCVYWPAFLLAADLPLPKAITAHGWLLFEESKMSKSRGNIVRTETILDAFGTLLPKPVETDSLVKGTASAVPQETPGGAALAAEVRIPSPSAEAWKHEQDLFATDVLRYFLLREIPFGQDGSFSFDALVQRYNSDLANGYGNLVSRTLTMIYKYFDGVVPEPRASSSLPERAPVEIEKNHDWFFYHPQSLAENGEAFLVQVQRAFARADSPLNLNDLQSIPLSTDTVISAAQPWKKNLSNPEERAIVQDVLYFAAEAVRLYTAAIHPILPYATAKVWTQLGLGDIELAAKNGELKDLKWGGLKPGTRLGERGTLFPSIKKEDIPRFIQLMIDMEQNNAPKPAEPASAETNSTHPGAPPRTSAFNEPNPGAQVGGAAAPGPDLVKTPPHTEAPASAPFAASAAASSAPDTPQIAIDDFVKVDLRVAKIVVAERIPKADKLLRLEVDLGYERRQILSGIAEWYTPEELIGRRIVVIANLAPRKMRGLESHGMLLAASAGENGKPILATFAEDIALGSRLK